MMNAKNRQNFEFSGTALLLMTIGLLSASFNTHAQGSFESRARQNSLHEASKASRTARLLSKAHLVDKNEGEFATHTGSKNIWDKIRILKTHGKSLELTQAIAKVMTIFLNEPSSFSNKTEFKRMVKTLDTYLNEIPEWSKVSPAERQQMIRELTDTAKGKFKDGQKISIEEVFSLLVDSNEVLKSKIVRLNHAKYIVSELMDDSFKFDVQRKKLFEYLITYFKFKSENLTIAEKLTIQNEADRLLSSGKIEQSDLDRIETKLKYLNTVVLKFEANAIELDRMVEIDNAIVSSNQIAVGTMGTDRVNAYITKAYNDSKESPRGPTAISFSKVGMLETYLVGFEGELSDYRNETTVYEDEAVSISYVLQEKIPGTTKGRYKLVIDRILELDSE